MFSVLEHFGFDNSMYYKKNKDIYKIDKKILYKKAILELKRVLKK